MLPWCFRFTWYFFTAALHSSPYFSVEGWYGLYYFINRRKFTSTDFFSNSTLTHHIAWKFHSHKYSSHTKFNMTQTSPVTRRSSLLSFGKLGAIQCAYETYTSPCEQEASLSSFHETLSIYSTNQEGCSPLMPVHIRLRANPWLSSDEILNYPSCDEEVGHCHQDVCLHSPCTHCGFFSISLGHVSTRRGTWDKFSLLVAVVLS